MKCFEREQLFVYFQRLLDAREEEQVRAHLGECPACRGVVEQYRKLDRTLEEWKPVDPSPAFDARVRAAVAAVPEQRALFGFDWVRWLAPAGLLVLLVAASVFVLRMGGRGEMSQPAAQQSPAKTVETRSVRPQAAKEGEEELTLYQNLPVLEDEDYDLIANFEVLSELPRGEKKVVN